MQTASQGGIAGRAGVAATGMAKQGPIRRQLPELRQIKWLQEMVPRFLRWRMKPRTVSRPGISRPDISRVVTTGEMAAAGIAIAVVAVAMVAAGTKAVATGSHS